MIIIGIDKFKSWGPPRKTKHGTFTPTDNCRSYESFGYNPCDSGFVIGEWFEDEDVLFIEVDKIQDEKYIYPICVRNLGHAFGIEKWSGTLISNSFLDILDDKVLTHIRNGQAKLLLFYGYEGDSISGDSIMVHEDEVKEKLKGKNIPLKNVIYSDSNVILKEQSEIKDIKLIPVNYCPNTYYRYNTQFKRNLYHGSDENSKKNRTEWESSKNKLRSKHFLCYNRLPKSHRASIVLSLFKNNNLDKGFVSFPKYGTSSWDVVEKEEEYLKSNHYSWLLGDELAAEFEKYSDNLIKRLPLVLDKENFEVCHSIICTEIPHYLNSYFTICNESRFDHNQDFGNTIFLTEKILKPIINLHPFILVGNAYTLEKMREYGFKTFSPFIDESYDEIGDTTERFIEIEKQINNLCSKSLEELHEWYWSIEDILKYNYYHFYKVFAPQQKQKFLNELNDVIK
jgi:hypothetical protein